MRRDQANSKRNLGGRRTTAPTIKHLEKKGPKGSEAKATNKLRASETKGN